MTFVKNICADLTFKIQKGMYDLNTLDGPMPCDCNTFVFMYLLFSDGNGNIFEDSSLYVTGRSG